MAEWSKKRFLLFICLFVSACTPGIRHVPQAPAQQGKPNYTLDVYNITPDTIEANNNLINKQQPPLPSSFVTSGKKYIYRVNSGDIIGITVWEHPELNDFQSVTTGNQTLNGYVVDDSGCIYYPYIGKLYVRGLSTEQINRFVSRKLATYIKSPVLNVKVISYRSQHVDVIGEVLKTQPIAINDTPLTIPDALSFSGGPNLNGDLNHVVLKRGKNNYIVNISDSKGMDLLNHVYLKDGDVIQVNNYNQNQVYVLGEVLQPAPVIMNSSPMTLTRALATSGGLNPITSNAKQVYVFRNIDVHHGSAYHLDLRNAGAYLLADNFNLTNQDVIYVSTYSLTNFNRVIRQMIAATASFNDLTGSAVDIQYFVSKT